MNWASFEETSKREQVCFSLIKNKWMTLCFPFADIMTRFNRNSLVMREEKVVGITWPARRS